MSRPIYIAFLWHMHQPLYKDWQKGWLSLPWVRLHAVKAYYDMPWVLKEFPEVHVTFNLVPSLLRQIEFYLEGGSDYFLELSRKPAEDLGPEEKEFIIGYFFSCNWESMIRPLPPYFSLLHKRGFSVDNKNIAQIAKEFSPQDIRDIQVWFNLVWIGFAHANHPLVKELKSKGRFFSEEEKEAVLSLHLEILQEIIPFYRDMQEEGQIEISTSPFFHPILPLIIDTDCTRRSLTQAPLPPRFSHPEDASLQIESALDYHERLFGRRPQGMWPSEGSVSPELVSLAAQAGLSWLATDEEILYRSLGTRTPQVLLRPYRVVHNGAQVAFVFRHHELSDRIGFVYQRLPAGEAVKDLLKGIYHLATQYSGKAPPLVTIILDGENPWEYYPDGGRAFLVTLYETLAKSREFRAITISEYLNEFPPERSFSGLYTGSWINANFDIWIGHEEENKAWELLGKVRQLVQEVPHLPEDARTAILAAEGSDWFWWFGDHFTTIFDTEFDRLFRQHLIHVLEVLGMSPLKELEYPVRRLRVIEPKEQPTAFIFPVIDGRETNFFEWSGAGRFEDKSVGEAMYLGESLIKAIYFGFDLKNFYLRLDISKNNINLLPKKSLIKIIFLGYDQQIEVCFRPRAEEPQQTLVLKKGSIKLDGERAGLLACESIIELAIPFQNLGFKVGEKVLFFVELLEDNFPRERNPRGGSLYFIIPDENFEQIMWQI